MELKPAPTKTNCLQRLIELGANFDTVIDVGVLMGTPELMSVFPKAKHLLFEPMDINLEAIKQAYSQHDFELFNVACSDVDGECYLVYSSVDGSGKATHSRISDKPVDVGFGEHIVSCKKIPQVRLDSLPLTLGKEILLKIDVDGIELRVLSGAEDILKKVGAIVIEAPIDKLLERATFLSKFGFVLFDIVDLCYYYKTLSQVDLVFVSRELMQNNKNLEPWKNKCFDWNEYVQYGV